MDLDKAVKTHGDWRVKLRSAIQSKEKLDARSIAADNTCELGKWLHGEAKAKYAGLKSFAACVDKHAAFHRAAGKVASAINAGQYTQAEAMLAGGTEYATASSMVGGAIIGLRKEANL